MDLVTGVLIPGVLGGLVVALLIVALQRRRSTGSSAPTLVDRHGSVDIINAARIRVAGVGGLGLVAMALVVAWNVPRIGQTLAVGLVLGAVLAVVLIYRRRKDGSMPSSGRRAGANTILSIDQPMPSRDDDESPRRRTRAVLAGSRAIG